MVLGAGGEVQNKKESNKELEALLKDRDTRWYKGHLLKLNLIIFLLLITSANNGYDGSMMNGLQTLKTWQASFGNPTGSLLGIFNAIQSIGGIAGLPFAPFVSDKFGRRATIFLGAILMIIGTILQTAAQNIGMFLGCRFIIGFGLAFSCLAAPVLITELAFPTHRAPITSLYNSTWYLGSIIAAWTTFGTFRINNTWGWRIPSLLQGTPALAQLLLIWFIPESPRWLVNNGRDEQAMAIIAKHHCAGNSQDPLVEFEYNEIKEAIRLETEANATASYKSLFATRGNRRRMRVLIAIAFFSQWSGNGVVSYYLNLVLQGIGVTSEGDKNLFNGILQVWNLGTAYFGALMVDRIGRRRLFLISTAGMCMAYMIWTIGSAIYAQSGDGKDASGAIINGNNNAARTVMASIFIYYGFYNIAMSPLLISYAVEILPFRIRSKGLMVLQMSVNASLVFNQYANPIAMKALDWKYYILYTVWIAFEFLFCYLFVIETKGKDGPLPLEEIAQLFDGEGNSVAAAVRGAGHAGIAHRSSLEAGGEKDLGDIKDTQQVETVNELR